MSQTIDRKVVEMKFDNSNFESNVKQSMNTLDQLKKNLDFEGSAEGFKQLSKAADGVSFEGLNQGIEDVNVHFSALETIGKRVLEKITDMALETGLSMAKSLSIDLVGSGFKQYESENGAVQTIMAATGDSIEDIEKRLSKLIWYSDETSASFSDMVDNVGKFTSTGVNIDEATNAMMGIFNWASASGASIPQASRAMYNLSQAMGLGAVTVKDWMSIENANMATLEFKQTAIDTAIALGKLTAEGKTLGKGTQVTAEGIRDTLTEKWFDNDVLIATLDKYNQYTNLVYDRVQETGERCSDAMARVSAEMGGSYEAIGEKAFKAGQEAKTFTEVMGAVQDAVKTQWSTLFKSVFGNYEEAKVTFTNMSNSLWEVFAAPLDEFNATVKEALEAPAIDLRQWNALKDEMKANMGLNNDQFLEFEKVLADVARDAGIDIDTLIEKNGSFAASVADGWLNTDIIQEAYDRIVNGSGDAIDATQRLADVQDIVNRVWAGEFGNGEARKSALEAMGYDYDEIQRLVALGKDAEITLEDLGETGGTLVTLYGSELATAFENSGDSVQTLQEMLEQVSGAELRNGIFENLFGDEDGAIVTYVDTFREAFANVFGTLDSGAIHDFLATIYEWTVKLLDEERIESFSKTVENIFHGIHAGITVLKGAFSVIKAVYDNTLGPIISGLWEIVKSLVRGIGGLFEQADSAAGSLTAFSDTVDWLNKKLAPVKKVIEAISNGIATFIDALFSGKGVLESFREAGVGVIEDIFGKNGISFLKKLEFNDFVDKLVALKESIVTTFKTIGGTVSDFWNTLKKSEFAKTVSNAIDKIKTSLSNAWNSIKNWFKTLISGGLSDDESVKLGVFDTIRNAIDRFNEWLADLDGSKIATSVSNFFTNFKENTKNAFANVKNWFESNETIQGAITTVKGKFKELKDSIVENSTDEGGEKKPFLTQVLEGLKSVVQWFIDNAPSLEDVINMIMAVISGTAFASLIKLVLQIKNLFSGGAGIATNFSKVLGGISLALKGFALNMAGAGIWSLAKSFALVIGVIVAGLIALTLVDQNKLATAGIVMLGVGAGITLLAKAMAEIMKTFKSTDDKGPKKITEAISEGISSITDGVKNYLSIKAYSSAIRDVAIAIGILVGSMFLLSKLSFEDIAKGILTIAALLLEVVVAIKLMGGEKKLAVDAGALMGLSGAIMGFVSTFKDIAKYNWEEIFKGIVTIGAILLEMTVFARYAKDVKVSTGVSMIAMAVAMLLFVKSIKKIAELEPFALLESVLALGTLMAGMVLVSRYSENIGIGGMATLLVIAVTVLMFTKAISQLAEYSWDQLLFSVLAIGAVMAEMVAFSKFMEKVNVSLKTMAGMVVLALSVLIFTKSIKDLAQYNWSQLLVAVLAIGAIMAEMVIFAKAFQGVSLSLKEGIAMAAVSAAVMSLAIALKMLSTIPWPTLITSAAAIAGIILAIGGAAALLSRVQGNIEGISKLLIALAALIAAVSAAIWLVTTALKDADIDGVKGVLGDLVTTLVQNIINAIVGSLDAIVSGILDMLTSLAENVPQIVDTVIEIIIKVLDALTTRLPELATAMANFCGALLTSFAEAFQNVDITPFAKIIQNLLIGTIGLALVGKFGSFASVTKGIGMLAEVIAAFGLLIAAFGALNLIPGFKEFMEGGVDALCVVADGIGSFVGTLVGSVAESFTESLPAIGTNLSLFMENIQGFIDGASKIDSTFLDAIGFLTLALLEITGANFVDTVLNGLSWLFGGGSSSDFMSKFVDLGTALSAFADSIKDVDFSAVDGAANAAAVIMALTDIVPKSGGLWQSIVGESNFENIDTNFSNLGKGVAAFCESIAGITIDDSTAAAADTAATIIQNLMDKAVPATGGLWQKIVGEKDLGASYDNFSSIGKGVAAFCSAIDGISVDQVTVTTAGMASDIIANMMDKSVTTTGGLWQKITGEKDVSNADSNFESIGKGVAAFCSAIEGITIDQVTVTTAGMAADIIAEIMDKSVSTSGGLWQRITGEKDVSNAGDNFKNIGEGISEFCKSIEGITIDQETVDTAGRAADAVALIMSKGVSSQGGLWQKITGEKDVTNAGTNFKNIGEGVVAFCKALEGVTIDQVTVTTAGMAAEVIAEIMGSEAVLTSGSIWEFITGAKDPSSTPENFKHIGQGVANFCKELEGVSIDQTTISAASSAAAIIAVMSEITPKTGGLWQDLTGETDFSKLGEGFGALGEGVAEYLKTTGLTTKTQVQRGIMAATGMIDLINLDWPSTSSGLFGWLVNGLIGGSTSFEDLGEWLKQIAEMAVNTSNAFADVSLESISSAKDAAQGMIDILDLGWPKTDEGFVGWISGLFGGSDTTNWSTLGQELSDMGSAIKSFSESVSGVTGDSVTAASSCASVMNSLITNMPSDLTSLDDISTYGDNVKAFGESMASYSTSVSSMNFNAVTLSIVAIAALIKTLDTMSDVDFDKASNFSTAIGKLGQTGVNKFAEAFSKGETKAKQSVTTFLRNIVTTINQADSQFRTAGSSSLSAYTNGLIDSGKILALVNAAKLIVQAVVLALTNTESFSTAGTNSVNAYGNAFARDSTVGNKAAGLGREAARNMSQYNNFVIAGRNCIIGAINGMYEKATILYQTAYDMGVNSSKWYNKGAGVKSPSWKFREATMYCVEGAVQGFEKYAYKLNDAAEETGVTSVEVMKNALGGLNFENLDNTPTIRPVIDLTDVQNGVNRIDEMLQTGSSIGIGTIEAQRLANSINGLNMNASINNSYDDSAVIAVINDLGDRVDNLNSAINNMKLYLNGRDLVGGIMPEINNNMKAYEGRLNRGVK